jgi:hypothetical protein
VSGYRNPRMDASELDLRTMAEKLGSDDDERCIACACAAHRGCRGKGCPCVCPRATEHRAKAAS